MLIKEIIKIIEGRHKRIYDTFDKTCDGVIIGNADKECTGIAVTCCPTAEVISKAAKQNCNFILCHEPTFFDGWDRTDWLKENCVYNAKKKLIEETNMTIYRIHDQLHSVRPDGIFYHVTRKLGWEKYAIKKPLEFMPGCCFELPETTVGEIAAHLAKVMHIDGMRIIGNPDMKVTRAGIIFHFSGNEMDRTNIQFIEENDMQVIIPGEVVDWTIGEYVQDAVSLGIKRALLNPGHFNWEEPGMEGAAEWLADDLHHEVPVIFIQSGNQYKWLSY